LADVAYLHYQIADDLHRRAKSAAALTGVSLKAFIEEAIEQATTKAEAAQARRRAK
jgi:predicted HicB family RNase H-like nuclease